MRALLYALLGLVLLVLGVLAAAFVMRVSLVDSALRSTLAQAGFPDATYELTDVSLSSSTIENLRLSPDGPSAERIEVRYTLPGLLNRTVDAVVIEGARTELDLSAQGGAPAGETPILLPVDMAFLERLGIAFMLSDAQAILRNTGAGDLVLTLDATADFKREGAPLTAEARLAQTPEPRLFQPLRFTLDMMPDGQAFTFTGRAGPDRTDALLPVAGRLDPETQAVEAEIGPGPVRFTRNGVQPRAFSPMLETLREADGTVRLQSALSYDPETGVESGARLVIEDLDVRLPTGRLEGLAGSVEIRDLIDPRTPPQQTLSARRFLSAIPLEEPTLVFQLEDNGDGPVVRIESAQGGLAGGLVRVVNTPIRINADTQDLVLTVESLSLPYIYEEWSAGRLSGTGMLSGAIPLRVTGGGVVIENGRVAAMEPGQLTVNWGDARGALIGQGDQVALMVRALEGFEYERFEIGLERPAQGELAFAITLEGRNPGVLSGQPFVFNINLSGNLEDLLTAIGDGVGITADMLSGGLDSGR